MEHNLRGFSFYVCIGKYAGFHFYQDGPAVRLILGYVAIVFMRIDLEQFTGMLRQDAMRYRIARTAHFVEFEHQEIVTNSRDGVSIALDYYCDEQLKHV